MAVPAMGDDALAAAPPTTLRPFPPMPFLSPVPSTTAHLPTLTFLPADHFSRRVVELIFSSAWSSPPPPVDMVFRVEHPPETLTTFETHRNAVRLRAGPGDDPRCVADGNEMLRFCSPESPPSRPVRTFAGSSDVELAGGRTGRGAGRAAVLVCRVIVGRVRTGQMRGGSAGFDSVRVRDAEVVVHDPVAVLPCFLLVYRTRD